MSWSGLLKVFTGLFLAIALLAGGGFLAAQFFIAKLSTPPAKPIYPNDKPASLVKSATKTKATSPDQPNVPDAPPKPLPSGAYEGRVTQSIGLILRDAPGRDSGQTGGVDYNEKVIVLETSSDGEWQKVRVQSNDQEGWVKAGNTEKSP